MTRWLIVTRWYCIERIELVFGIEPILSAYRTPKRGASSSLTVFQTLNFADFLQLFSLWHVDLALCHTERPLWFTAANPTKGVARFVCDSRNLLNTF